MSGDHHSRPPSAPTGSRPLAGGVLGRLRTKRIWLALGLLVGGVGLISNFADFPTLSRWTAWAALAVIAVFILAGVYIDSWGTVLAITVTASCAVSAGVVAIHPPDLSGEPRAQAGTDGGGPVPTKPDPPKPTTAAVADRPQAIVFAFERWWVLHQDGSVLALDGQGEQRFVFHVGGPATDIAACSGALLIIYGHGWLGRFSPQTGKRLAHYHFGSRSNSVTCGEGSAWVDKPGEGSVVRMDAHTLRLDYELAVGGQLTAIAYGDGAIWGIDAETNTVVGVDADTRELIRRFPVMEDAIALSFAGGRLWVTHAAQSCLMRLDVERRREVGPGIPLGPLPVAPAGRDGVLYVVDYTDGSLRQIDAQNGQPVAPPTILGDGLRLVGVDVHAGRLVAIDRAGDAALVLQPRVLRAMAAAATTRTRRSRSCPSLAE